MNMYMVDNKRIRVAAFGGFRSIPPKARAGGADKVALELYPRIAKRGHSMIAYARIYPGESEIQPLSYEGVQLKYFKTVGKAGFDTLLHSAKATFDIIYNNTADSVHLQSGANSIWALFLRIFGKHVVLTQFAMDWKRDKWSWYAKIFYLLSNYATAYFPNKVVIDNIYTKQYFEDKFSKEFEFIPYGSEVKMPPSNLDILNQLGLETNEYFIFVGRFIPDKGLHILLEAFKSLETDKKLVLVGGSPYESEYEKDLRNTKDNRVVFAGYVYGDDTNILMKYAYAFVQPSFIEGLSPVILTAMGLGTPLICSDIKEITFITGPNALIFEVGNVFSLKNQLQFALTNAEILSAKANAGKADTAKRFNWETITDSYIQLLEKSNK